MNDESNHHAPRLLRWLLSPAMLCLFLSVGHAAARPSSAYTVGAVPSWVEEYPLPGEIKIPEKEVRSGTYYLLVDNQVSVSRRPTEHYHRQARKVLSSTGVQNASEIKISFDPTYERL